MAQRFLTIAGLAFVLASGFPAPGTGHDWYKGLTSSAGVACCGSAECRPAAARYNERTGSWETEVIEDTWLPVPPGALAPIPSPDGNYHVCEYAGTIRCFFQPGQVKRDPLESEERHHAARGGESRPGATRSPPVSGMAASMTTDGVKAPVASVSKAGPPPALTTRHDRRRAGGAARSPSEWPDEQDLRCAGGCLVRRPC